MPELPEVETVVRDLRPLLAGRTIASVAAEPEEVAAAVEGGAGTRQWPDRRVEGVRRRGKWILVDLRGEQVLRVHLGMTGQFTVVAAAEPEPDHLHLVFALDNGTELRFRDPRRFGSAELFADRAAVEAER